MRKLRLTWGMLAAVLLLAFPACQNEETVGPVVEENFTDARYQLEDLQALEKPVVSEATETAGFSISSTDARQRDHRALSFILPKLNLSDRQKMAVRGFVQDHAACVSDHRARIQELHEELLKKANAVREQHLQAYRAGRITKAELEQRLLTLRDRLRAEINQHEQKQWHLRAMRKCRVELMINIASVLTREQLQLWNRWKMSL